ncbi:MAG TPA: O-antigen ligase family protein [Patescibacteria group bacterium]|nr:O-antigen ligase family protein [Patescibacteria group bacterium]
MIKYVKSLEKYLVFFLIFLLPTQLAYHFWPQSAFVFGIRVDLLSPSIYLTDILIVGLFLTKVVGDVGFLRPLKKYKNLLLFILLFVIINSLFSITPAVSVYKWFKVVEMSFVTLYFSKQNLVEFSSITKSLFYSSIFFSLIGIIQFFKGGTIGGLFYYLGERSFNLGSPGIALVSLGGALYLRAYSTFSHPNSLAGFLGVITLLILLSGKLRKTPSNILGLLIILSCFILSFSISAYLGVFLSFALYLFSKNKKVFKFIVLTFLFLSIIGSLLLPIMSPWILKTFALNAQNITERLNLSYIAGKVISHHFLLGAGLGTFIINIPMFRGIFSYSWILQPVHNIYLLVFSEAGIIAFLTFCYLIYKVLMNGLKKNKLYLLLPLIFILFTGLFDHYWLTLQQNLILVSLLLGLSFRITT